MTDCIFCKIIAGEIPASMPYSDDLVVALDDINPAAPIHKLIIPRVHIPTLNDLDEEHKPLIGHMTTVAAQLADKYGIAEDGYRVLMNCNAGGGQTVFHLHMHLVGGRGMKWPPG